MRARSLRLVACLVLAGATGCRRADPEAVSAAEAAQPARASRAPGSASPLRTPRSVRLQRISSEQGLSHNSVYAILQDSRGFIWFGTQDGLDRYDGHAFLSYKHDPTDSRSLASSWISALLEDRAGRLWVGTRGGLHRQARDGTGFDRISLSTPNDPRRLDRSRPLRRAQTACSGSEPSAACFALTPNVTMSPSSGTTRPIQRRLPPISSTRSTSRRTVRRGPSPKDRNPARA